MKDLEDIYPLTPMQEAMLLHAVGNPASSELHTQIVFRLHPAIDLELMDWAWACLIKQHASLRTGFHWQSEKGPLQFVRRQVDFTGHVKQLSVSPNISIDDQIDEVLMAEKAVSFDLAKAPLMRVTYLVLDHGERLMLWTSHHLVLDRWCNPLIIAELENYLSAGSDSLSAESHQPPAPFQFKSYIAYISAQETAVEYWQTYLQGYRGGSSLVSRISDTPGAELFGRERALSISHTDLAEFNRQMDQTKTTAAALCQLAWALTISKVTSRADVVLGVTVSGRPPTLRGVDRIIGCFINNVPVRTVIHPSTTLVELLQGIAAAQQERQAYEHVSLLQLNKALESASNTTLVDTLFLWLDDMSVATVDVNVDSDASAPMVALQQYGQEIASAFPLTLTVSESQRGLDVSLKMAAGYESAQPLDEILEVFREVLLLICASDANTALAGLLGLQVIQDSTNRINTSDVTSRSSKISSSMVIKDRNSGREALEPAYVQQALIQKWKDILELDELVTSSSFFDMGGNSLNAVQLHTHVESMLRCSIPIISLFRKPYLADMVELIVENDWSMKADICLPVRAGGSALPLFCVATPDVNTIGFAQLANHISRDRPVYVLQSPPESAEFRELSPGEIPDLAKTYVDAMRAVQPQGPYHLLGMCTGSELAFEMAKILENNQDACGFVGILNTWATYTVARTYRLRQAFVRFELLQQERLRDWPVVIWHRLIGPRVLKPLKRRFFTSAMQRHQVLTEPTRSSVSDGAPITAIPGNINPENSIDGWIHICGWHHLYKPIPKLKQKLTVFRLKEQPFWRIKSENLGWGLHGENIELKHLACDDHHNLLREPWIRELGASIDSSLQEYS